MGVSCSSPCVAEAHHLHRDDAAAAQEAADSKKIEEADALVEYARELRECGNFEGAFQYLVAALKIRVDYLGLNDADDVAMTKTMRRLSQAVPRSVSSTPNAESQPTKHHQPSSTLVEHIKRDREKSSIKSANNSGSSLPHASHQMDSSATPLNDGGAPAQPASTSSTPLPNRSDTRRLSDASSSNPNSDAEQAPGGSNTQRQKRRRRQPRLTAFTEADALREMRAEALQERGSGLNSRSSSSLGAHIHQTITKPRAYFHSHVSLLNDIGLTLLRLGSLHISFFYFFEAISILSPVLTASANAGTKHSGLPTYVDAITGLVLVYISLADAVAPFATGGLRDTSGVPATTTANGNNVAGPIVAQMSANRVGDSGTSQPQITISATDDVTNGITFAFREMMPLDPIYYSSAAAGPHASSTTALINSSTMVSFADGINNNSGNVAGATGPLFATPGSGLILSVSSGSAPPHPTPLRKHDPADTTMPPTTVSSQLLVAVDDLREYGIDASPAFRASVQSLAERLDGCHPLIVARDQLEESVRIITNCDNNRSVYLIPIMHMQCRIALIFGQKKLALHYMQKCLGLTYWYRNGASDAYALAIYSHDALGRIRQSIKKDDSAVKIQRWYWRRVADRDRATEHYRRMHAQEPRILDYHYRRCCGGGRVGEPQAPVASHGGTAQSNNTLVHPFNADERHLRKAVTPTPRRAAGTGKAKPGDIGGGSPEPAAHGSPQPDHPVTLQSSPGGRAEAATYTLPQLRADADDALMPQVHTTTATPHTTTTTSALHATDDHDEDDEEDDMYSSLRTERVAAAKDNVVSAISTLFQTMQRTCSAASMSTRSSTSSRTPHLGPTPTGVSAFHRTGSVLSPTLSKSAATPTKAEPVQASGASHRNGTVAFVTATEPARASSFGQSAGASIVSSSVGGQQQSECQSSAAEPQDSTSPLKIVAAGGVGQVSLHKLSLDSAIGTSGSLPTTGAITGSSFLTNGQNGPSASDFSMTPESSNTGGPAKPRNGSIVLVGEPAISSTSTPTTGALDSGARVSGDGADSGSRARHRFDEDDDSDVHVHQVIQHNAAAHFC